MRGMWLVSFVASQISSSGGQGKPPMNVTQTLDPKGWPLHVQEEEKFLWDWEKNNSNNYNN